MKRTITIAGICLALAFTAQPAAAAPARVLDKATLDRFLDVFPEMVAELETLGDDLSGPFDELGDDGGDSGGFSMDAMRAGIEAAFADARVKAILSKYGWDARFIEVYATIISGYMYIAFEEIYATYPMEATKLYLDEVKGAMHPDDIALLKANRARIEAVLGMED